MSYSTVPQHLVCMNIKPPSWASLFHGAKVKQSIPSGHLAYDEERECYFPVVDEAFEGVWSATSNLSKHVTVACSAVMTVALLESDDIAKTMDILDYRETDDDGNKWAEVRVHMPAKVV